MSFTFWDMLPGAVLTAEISKISNMRQRALFLSVADALEEYNSKNDSFLTFGEFIQIYKDNASE